MPAVGGAARDAVGQDETAPLVGGPPSPPAVDTLLGGPPEPDASTALAKDEDDPAADSESPPELPAEITLREFLVLPPADRSGRTAIHQDPIEVQLVGGTFQKPEADQQVQLSDSVVRTWRKATADEDGWLSGRGVRGGYVYTTLDSPAARVMIFQPRGHGGVYVNGSLRTGDPYDTGWLRLPVKLQAGRNEFLFHGGRGRMQARLVKPASPLMIDLADTTLPDVIVGERGPWWCAVLVVNATDQPLDGVELIATPQGGSPTRTDLTGIPPLSTRKAAFSWEGAPPEDAEQIEVRLQLVQGASSAAISTASTGGQDGETVPLEVSADTGHDAAANVVDTKTLTIPVRRADGLHRRTFVSQIDGSVQYYGVQPAQSEEAGDAQPGLILTLHGAGVEAANQAAQYAPKPWAHVVAPTNRRPFGFDWEDWGRLDALEVLAQAEELLHTDTRRTYLTGHSMGGHGTWILGATYCDRFAAIGPSAGWRSFFSYGGMRRYEDASEVEKILMRAANPSDTLKIKQNFQDQGVYILHGDQDDNVPVSEARAMREELAEFHPDFAYYERPGAGHWWGAECCDWPPMMEFLERRSLPDPLDKPRVKFATVSPGVSARAHWLSIDAQRSQLELSEVDIEQNAQERRFEGTTENVARLSLDVRHWPSPGEVEVELDGQQIDDIAWPADTGRIWLERGRRRWRVIDPPSADEKGPHRYGSFKDVFRNRVQFVYGTQGTDEENAWALAKARLDAETFWYRGNGSIDVITDVQFDAAAEPDRNVVLYGNADTNAAWPALLSTSPIQIRRGRANIDIRPEMGEQIGCLMIRPRPDSHTASVGVVGGTGLVGMKLTDRLRYFVSGVAYPDVLLVGPEYLTEGTQGVRMAGFFGLDWQLDSGEIVWRDVAL
ncbi:MAG: prolyl oligopeptidase family serine peptidase [Pirellulales bacterium]